MHIGKLNKLSVVISIYLLDKTCALILLTGPESLTIGGNCRQKGGDWVKPSTAKEIATGVTHIIDKNFSSE